MSELSNMLFTEKYRAGTFEDLIFEHKDTLINYLTKPKELPSFIFISSSPGTGKSSCARLISKYLDCDVLPLNSSMERGIETIRDKIKWFVQSMSSNNAKRMVFCDEADFITSQAQASLRNLMEEYSDNCFFVFTGNDLAKIIPALVSRCIVFDFNKPNKKQIFDRLEYICKEENIDYDPEDLSKLINLQYPDVRAMVLTLQSTKVDNKPLLVEQESYNQFLQYLVMRDEQQIYLKAFSSDFNILGFNKWLFHYLFLEKSLFSFEELSTISLLLADTEKNYNLGVNLPILFIANMLQISNIISRKKLK
jgi:replication factor C small subunit